MLKEALIEGWKTYLCANHNFPPTHFHNHYPSKSPHKHSFELSRCRQQNWKEPERVHMICSTGNLYSFAINIVGVLYKHKVRDGRRKMGWRERVWMVTDSSQSKWHSMLEREQLYTKLEMLSIRHGGEYVRDSLGFLEHKSRQPRYFESYFLYCKIVCVCVCFIYYSA